MYSSVNYMYMVVQHISGNFSSYKTNYLLNSSTTLAPSSQPIRVVWLENCNTSFDPFWCISSENWANLIVVKVCSLSAFLFVVFKSKYFNNFRGGGERERDISYERIIDWLLSAHPFPPPPQPLGIEPATWELNYDLLIHRLTLNHGSHTGLIHWVFF